MMLATAHGAMNQFNICPLFHDALLPQFTERGKC